MCGNLCYFVCVPLHKVYQINFRWHLRLLLLFFFEIKFLLQFEVFRFLFVLQESSTVTI